MLTVLTGALLHSDCLSSADRFDILSTTGVYARGREGQTECTGDRYTAKCSAYRSLHSISNGNQQARFPYRKKYPLASEIMIKLMIR